ncbi:MAG: rhomboid family intramembrane serine protease, partial [Leptospirales bacterium]|nr:rhomboid family intramembrane serine protease [Leptospirales bacterium]
MSVYAIIAVNVLVSLAGFVAFRNNQKVENFLFIPAQLQAGNNALGWLLSHFAHSGWLHLGLNMLAFWSFADSVLVVGGALYLLFVYVAAGLAADLAVYILQRNNAAYRCLGASGSVVGVVFAAIVYHPTIDVAFWGIPIPGPLFALGFLVLSLVLSRSGAGGISHEAHAGGALGGFVAAALTAPQGL